MVEPYMSHGKRTDGLFESRIFEYEYYGTPVRVRYDSQDHFFEASSPAFLPLTSMTLAPKKE